MKGLLLCVSFVVAACGGDDGDGVDTCATGAPCATPGDTCAGFESDFVCTPQGHWKCVPSDRVGDPCRAPDAGVDAPVDAP